MRRDVRILMATAVLGAVAQWGHEVPEALSRVEVFRLSDVQVRGTRFMTEDEVVSLMELTPEMSVWTDRDVLAERIRAHVMVHDVTIARRVPNGLTVEVVERRPIALAPTPLLEPIDAEGRRLPLDPAEFRLDLPIIATPRTPPSESALFPEDVRVLAAEVAHLMSADTAFLQMVSSVRWGDRGELVARWTEPSVEFLLPRGASPSRLREGLGALTNALATSPTDAPYEIDLRFADQVVVRRGGH